MPRLDVDEDPFRLDVHAIRVEAAPKLPASRRKASLHTPDRWGDAESEANLFDLPEITDRWDKASGSAFLTTPEISGDGAEAMAVATLYLTNGPMVIRLYWLEKRDSKWRVRSQIDVEEGGC